MKYCLNGRKCFVEGVVQMMFMFRTRSSRGQGRDYLFTATGPWVIAKIRVIALALEANPHSINDVGST